MVILCLCSFTALRTLSAEPPINKKRTRTLFHKESGSSTNCMVDGKQEQVKAGYHHAGGILPFVLICFISRSQHPLQYSLRENSP